MPPSFRGAVGLYVNPPDRAVVISADGKTRIQALGRTRKPLPMKPGHPETRTHDYKRDGTACLMAALDNVSSHKSAEVSEWLKENPDWAFHFTPAPASWMNAVEGFFSKLSRQRLRHAVINSLDECVAAIEGYIAHHNAGDARPFRWSRKP